MEKLLEVILYLLPLFFQLLLLYWLSEQFQKMQIRLLGFKAALYFFAPGVIIHELSHWLACVLTSTPVGRVALFSPREKPTGSGNYTLGYVEHGKPNFIAQIVISLAPFFGVTAFVVLALKFLYPGLDLPAYQETGFSISLVFNLDFVKLIFSRFNLLDFRVWLFWYLMMAVLPGAAPSKEDLAPFFRSFLWFSGLFFLLFLFFQLLGVYLTPFFKEGAISLLYLTSSCLGISITCTLIGIALLWLFSGLRKI